MQASTLGAPIEAGAALAHSAAPAADLFVNMNNWLTQQEDLISIHPRDAGDDV